MATQTTGGGSTTSLNYTPQAVDDCYIAGEDQVLYFSVMDNDLGGAAKVLWSIDNTSDDGSTDLLCKDVAGVCEFSELGARISLTSDGKIKYDTTLLDSLGAGQTVIDQFTYAIRLSNGTLSWATVTVTLTGTNDAPEISLLSGDSAAACFNEGNSPLSTSGTLTVVDVDTIDVVDTTVTGVAVTGNQGTLTEADLLAMLNLSGDEDLAANTGDAHNLGWNFDSTPEAFDYLADGQTLVLAYTLTSTDNNGASDTHTVTITIHGTNDGPVANADSGSADENETKSFDVIGNDTDVDDGAVLSLASIDGVTVDGVAASVDEAGAFSIDGDEVKFTPGTAFDHLAEGDSATVEVSYTVEDEHGASSSAVLTITVTGTNDGPEAEATNSVTTDEDTASAPVAIGATDVDDGDTLTYSVKTGEEPAKGTVSFNQALGTFVYTPDADENGSDSFTILIDDGHGGTTEQVVTVTINPVNDDPTLAPVTAGSISEVSQSSSTTSGGLSGTLSGADIDGDTLTYGIQGGSASGVNLVSLAGTYGTLTVNILTGAYSYAPNAAAIEGLDSGENPADSFTVTVNDGHGGTATQAYVVNLHGADDAPTLAAVTSGSIAEVGGSSSTISSGLSGTLVGSDIDVETLTYGIQGGTVSAGVSTLAGTYGTLTVNIATGAYTYTPNSPAIEALNAGQNPTDVFTMTVSDGDAPLGTQTYTVNITGANDFTYTPPPLSTAADPNDHDDDHSGSVAPSLVIMSPGSGVNGPNTVEGSNGTDTIYAGTGSDEVYGHNGGDHIYGEQGADMSLYGQRGDDFIYGGSGGDEIYGGSGNDTIYGNTNPDAGGDAGDTIYGGSGRDTIYGQGGDDVIIGGNGQDLLTGGDGADIFKYEKATDTGDFIFDFNQVQGDKIDLSAFGFDASDFVGAISGAGQVGAGQFGYMTYNNGTTTVTTIYVDTDGVYGADMEITIVAPVTLTGSDFLI